MGECQSEITDGRSNGRYTGTHVYPGVGEHKGEISVFMLPLPRRSKL